MIVWPKECIEWSMARNTSGYGCGWIGSVSFRAHRRAWELINGKIPSGLCVLHACDNPPCFNVAHLRLGTQRENVHDMMNKGRRKSNPLQHEKHHMAKLGTAEANEIRVAFRLGAQQKQLASLFGVSKALVSQIVKGMIWIA